MEYFESEEFVLLRLEPGDRALESIREAIDDAGIDTGVVVSGIGTFRTLNVHYVDTTDLTDEQADRNTTLELEGAWEVTNIEGIVADGEPHLHVTAFDGDRTVGGHLEDGCVINVLGEVAIRKVPDLALTRRPDDREISMLERR